MRLRLLAAVLFATAAGSTAVALPAAAGPSDPLVGRWSGSVRAEAGIVSAVIDVQGPRIGKTAGTLSLRGPAPWDCNIWLEYAGTVDGVHAYLPRRKNDAGEGIDRTCNTNDSYVEIGGSGMHLRWLREGKPLIEVPMKVEQ
ncbi:hypothetical protein [Caenispirillum bisanense]|uniref:hypothetical protein n=1 Tax=Caenispirillum bisanense TaxID=414052 RepID=UPI0031DA951D